MNVILGTISNYKYEQVYPFLASLNRTGYRDKLVLFTENISEDVIVRLQAVCTNFILETLPFHRELFGFTSICCLRYSLYSQYLKITECSNVMLTDTRDVLFQKNPFDYPFTKKLNFFLEESKRIGDCSFNSKWIRVGFGDDCLKVLEDRLVSCSGTTMGTASGVQDYLEHMISSHMFTSPMAGIDQGIHNYLIYTNTFPYAQVFPNGVGPVLTLGYMASGDIRFRDGLVLDKSFEVVDVIHQYDRHIDLMRVHYGLPI